MDLLSMEALFAKYSDEYSEFDRVTNKFSNRSDLNAFILLDKILPGDTEILVASEHDEVFLDIDCKKLAKVIHKDDVLTLIRCGVRYSDGQLQMFV